MKKSRILFTFTVIFVCQMIFAANFPIKVNNGKIVYSTDEKGNRVLDYSYCGYRQSEDTIPFVAGKVFVPNTVSDASYVIQQAINQVSELAPDSRGFRGAVVLAPGKYELGKSLVIRVSGVVLRGSGKKETFLSKSGVERGSLIYIKGKDDFTETDTCAIKSNYVPVNALSFEVSRPGIFKTGDRIIIHRPSVASWIASVKCDIFGGGISALGWKPGDVDINWDRKIVSVNGNTVTIDAPLSTAIDAKYGVAFISKYIHNGRVLNAGIENLLLESEIADTINPKYEDHCWNGISVENAEDCWIRQIDFRHFAGSAVFLLPSAMRITTEDCRSYAPVSEIGGHRRLTFHTMGQLNLFQRCYSEEGIHDFAAGYRAPGPNAFVQCESFLSKSYSGSIGSWASGLLFDVVNIDGNNLTFKNIGQDKNGMGWNTANSMFWQCSAAEIECFSPSLDAQNSAYGCWAQFSGDGNWAESNNHVQPRSLFYAQLSERLGRDVSKQANLMSVPTEASSSPTVEMAARMAEDAKTLKVTLQKWIEKAGINNAENTIRIPQVSISKPMRVREYQPQISIVNGKITCDNLLISGGKHDVPWWNGKLRTKNIKDAKPALTRFVPGMEGDGLTDYPDSVISFMSKYNIAVLDQNYGLWYDRRRDDHERIRRANGDVWAPFYEQPFARSGKETAWDGLSKYDLTKPNLWYWQRLNDFSVKARKKGMLLFNEHFFQHNIIEAGAHWVDCPWRTVNNINNTGFNEPVNFAGDKRVFVADDFYDVQHPVRRELLRNYIRMCLNELSGQPNVVNLISAEYTGPLHFVQFWLDVIAEWQTETGKNPLVALSCTKDVQDEILKDPKRAAIVDIIDIRYWHYRDDGSLYAPEGGKNLAPRQHARQMKVGKVTFNEAYKAVSEYRTEFPDKAVTYYAENYPEMNWAVFMAGGSCPSVPVKNQAFLKAAVGMKPVLVNNKDYYLLENSGNDMIVYTGNKSTQISLPTGNYQLIIFDAYTGKENEKILKVKSKGNYKYDEKSPGKSVLWFKMI